MKKIISLMAMLGVLFSFNLSVFAESEEMNLESLDSQEIERKKIEMLIIEAERQATEVAQDKTLELIGKDSNSEDSNSEDSETDINDYDIYNRPEYKIEFIKEVNRLLDEHDIQLIDSGEGYEEVIISPKAVTSPPTSAITINAPNIYTSSQGYVIMANAKWKNKAWLDHMPWPGTNVGGADGFGIYFDDNTNIHIASTSFYTYDENLNSYNTNLYPHTINSAGVFYKAQDKVTNTTLNPYHNYTWDSAYVSVWPNFSGSVNAYARTRWVHTWGSTDISSVAVSTSGISVSFTTNNNAWDGVSNGYAHIKYPS